MWDLTNFEVKLFMKVVKLVITRVSIFFCTSTLIKKLLKTLGKRKYT